MKRSILPGVENGVVEARDLGGTVFLRFGLNPLAEYLAALYWSVKLGNDETRWKKWLEKLCSVEGFHEEIRGFLIAMEDCMTTYKDDFEIPDPPLEELRGFFEMNNSKEEH